MCLRSVLLPRSGTLGQCRPRCRLRRSVRGCNHRSWIRPRAANSMTRHRLCPGPRPSGRSQRARWHGLDYFERRKVGCDVAVVPHFRRRAAGPDHLLEGQERVWSAALRPWWAISDPAGEVPAPSVGHRAAPGPASRTGAGCPPPPLGLKYPAGALGAPRCPTMTTRRRRWGLPSAERPALARRGHTRGLPATR